MLDTREYESMAMLDFSDSEREKLGGCFNAVTAGFAALGRIDTDCVAPLVTVLNLHSIMREDVAVKLLPRDELLANAPEEYDGYFKVPGTLA